MNENLKFRFSILPIPEGEALTCAEIEARCVKQLHRSGGKCVQSLRNLAEIYARAGRHDEACQYVRQLIALTDNLENQASCYFFLGGVMERKRDYRGAVQFYREALLLEPCSNRTWYFIHNNIGFSLNQLGGYDEAIPYLKQAIKIDPNRANAYKNLGLALEAKGQYAEAAVLFVQATQIEASDGRSLAHLEIMIAAHPELVIDLPELRDWLEACRKAVEVAGVCQPDLKAKWKADRCEQKRK